MNDLIRSGIYTGMGSLVLAKQKLEELIEELIQNNELTQDEGQRIVQDIIHRAEDIRNEAEQKVTNLIDEALLAMKMPGRNELEANFSDIINEWRERLNQFKGQSLFSQEKTDKPSVN